MKKNRVFQGISGAWEEWLFMPIEEKYKELKSDYEKKYPNGNLEHFHNLELQFQNDTVQDLITKGTKREDFENEELHQRQLLIKYINDEMLKKSIEEKILKDACFSYNIEEIQKSNFYSIARREIENKGHFLFDGIKIFTPELSALFSTEKILVRNKVTGENKTIDGFDLFKLYKTSFNEGLKYYDENYNVSPKIIYGENAYAYIQDLHDNYFHVKHSGANEGWVFVKKFYPIFLSDEGISKHGYYAGIICKVDELVRKYTTQFKTFKKCELCEVEKSQDNILNSQPKQGIPRFKTDLIIQIFEILKDFFEPEEQVKFKELLETGENITSPILFLDNGNRLADAFKQLYEADLIIGCQKKELEFWIAKNFKYRYRGKIKSYTERYLNDIISSNHDKCQKPFLNVKQNKELRTYEILFP
jgi:hypothetical protein